MGGVGVRGCDSAPNSTTASGSRRMECRLPGETGAVPATSVVPDEREVGEAGTVTGSPFSWAQDAVMYHLIGPSDGSVGRRETAGTRTPGVLRSGCRCLGESEHNGSCA